MGDKMTSGFRELVELMSGLCRIVLDAAQHNTYMVFEDWVTEGEDSDWEETDVLELTTTELDALIDALTRARELRGGSE